MDTTVSLSTSTFGNEVFVSWQGQLESIPIEPAHTVGRLKQQVQKLFKLQSCQLIGLDVDEVPLRHLNLSSTQALIVSDPESSQRDFSIAQIQVLDTQDIEKEQVANSLCGHCTVLLKRCMYLTNQLFLHDHSACREENALLSAEVEKLRKFYADTAGGAFGGAGGEEMQTTIKKLEQELRTKVAKVEAEKRQAIEQIKQQMREGSGSAAPGANGTDSAANLDTEHEVQRYKTELERVRRERDSLKVAVFRHEKKEVDYLKLLEEHESRRLNYETYREEIERILAQKEKEKLTNEEEISILSNRVQELEQQWRTKMAEDDGNKSWEEKFKTSQGEVTHLQTMISNLQKQMEGLRDFEYLYKDSTNRLKLMEKDVSLTNEYQSSLKEAQIRCGLLEKEVRSLRGWENKYQELNAKLIVLEKQNLLNKEWENKWTHLDAVHKHTVGKVNELSAMLADHQDCQLKLEEAKRDAQRALRSLELRRKIQEDARVAFAELKPQLGCEFQDHKLGVVITKIRDGTPAARAGLQVKDIILTAGGDVIGNRNGMVKSCSRYGPGDLLAFTFVRGRAKTQLSTEVEVGATGFTPEEVRDVRRRMEGRVTDDDVARYFSQTNPLNATAVSNVTQALSTPTSPLVPMQSGSTTTTTTSQQSNSGANTDRM